MSVRDTNAVQLALEIEQPPRVFVPGEPDGVVGLCCIDVGVAPPARSLPTAATGSITDPRSVALERLAGTSRCGGDCLDAAAEGVIDRTNMDAACTG